MFSLLSAEFLALALITAVMLAVLKNTARQLAFLAANLVFVWVLLLGPAGALSTLLFALLGYLFTWLILTWPRRAFVLCLFAYVLVFVYMRNYYFLGWLLPDGARTDLLATVGLSFLFFKVVHVMVEARSGTLGQLTFINYLNYGLNFTAFMMGPIQRYQDFTAQWEGRKREVPLEFEAHLDAVLRILVGLVKAYVLAEWFAPFTLGAGSDVAAMPIGLLLLQIYAFYFYLYLNFAGYCDVVIGIGELLGVRPPENFDKPFLARNIADFWNRFHRSLTQWLTDYVFSPSYRWGLSRRGGTARPLLAMNGALLLTLMVSGLWHGTTLSFFLFGLLHGLYFVIYRSWEALLARRMGKKRMREWRRRTWVRFFGIVITFNAVAFSFLFFRLDAHQALVAFSRFFG
jgi:D-alanyl-lipoteichoic acid acyltransferase DltB (MBOAT superfamily)